MPAKIQVIFYSTYGHVWKLAEAVAEGARQVQGSDVKVFAGGRNTQRRHSREDGRD